MPLIYPSDWRNTSTGMTWRLERHDNLEGHPGVLASIPNNPNYKGVVNWAEDQNKLLLHTIYAVPKRQGLGSLLMYAFAQHAKEQGINELEILNANPHEHGFYKYVGWSYHTGTLEDMFTGVDAVRWGEIVSIPDENGGSFEILRAHLNCALVGTMQLIKDKSKASFQRKWRLQIEN